MIYSSTFVALAVCAGFVDVTLGQGSVVRGSRVNVLDERNLFARQDATPTCLDAKVIATGSFSDGQGGGVAGVAAGQAPSETDKANFINTGCLGKTITNGKQNKDGSCNPIPMGDIPAFDKMVTSIIISPAPGEDIAPNTDFDINLQVDNLNAGFFVNPTVNYYSAPQRVDKNGGIIGHVHVTIQTLGDSLTPKNTPDPGTFVHFKGIDDAGDGNGGLKNTVTGGLPAGFYRLCTLTSAANHQPVLMPVAQRGAQDDCTKFTVGQGKATGGNGGGATGGDNKSGNGNNALGGGGANDPKASDPNAGATTGGKDNNNAPNGNGAAATTTTAPAGSAQPTNTSSGNQGGKQGEKRHGRKGRKHEQQRRGPQAGHDSRNEFKSRPYVMI